MNDGIQRSIDKNKARLKDGEKQLEHFGATLRQHEAEAERRIVERKKYRPARPR